MTKEEAIWYLTPIAESASLERYKEALGMALGALKAQQEAEKNQPLTQADLRKMNGQIVYCLELNMDVRVSSRYTGWITIHYPLPNEKDCCKAHGLTLYAKKEA